MDAESRTLSLPVSGAVPSSTTSISSKGPIVVVGANGSGKSRLGSWIELEHGEAAKVHRISAQKSLMMPEYASPTSIDRAERALLWGHPDMDKYGYNKVPYRWGMKPSTFLLNDYEHLVNLLFSDESESNARWKRQVKESLTEKIDPPETRLDTVKRIWEEVLPHRELIIGGGKVETVVSGKPEARYNASEMSDGERVIFYLIGQALSAPKDGIVIIDEPELHLHRSIQATLWDKIEAERPDCLIVYLTHDLDFAASRLTATKVCLTGFDGQSWNWYVVPENDDIPEEAFLEILGSRKPIIFVEGDKGSLDYFLFQKLYPEFTIAPCGGASQVVHATRSFSSFETLHRLTSHGIIDRDFRDDKEVKYLKGMSVFVLEFSETENLLLSEKVLFTIAKHQCLEADFPDRFDKIKDIVFREMTHDREQLVSSITATKIEQKLKSYDAKSRGKTVLKTAISNLTSSIDVDALYDSTDKEVDTIIAMRD